jgi:hypothetical protein
MTESTGFQTERPEGETPEEAYRSSTGHWPEGYQPAPDKTPEEVYRQATGHWPGEKPANKADEEAAEDKFSHYLELANGKTVRFLIHPRKQIIPGSWNGVPVVRVHNSHAPAPEGDNEDE